MAKSTVEATLPLDVRALHRAGNLRLRVCFSWYWSWQRDGERAGSVSGTAHEDGITLRYPSAGESVTQNIAVEWTLCNYGGRRPWWRCPSCSRRVALLHGAGKYFACRRCYDLCHTSQLEQLSDRRLQAAWKIRHRLGQRDGGHFDPLPDKPKGMHWKTYSRLHLRCDEIELRDRMAMFARFGWRYWSVGRKVAQFFSGAMSGFSWSCATL